MKPIKIFKSMVLLILMSCLHACLEKEPDPELMVRFSQYYEAEKNHDWNKTYEMRTPKYKETVRLGRYISEMEKDYSGFDLLGYEIESSEISSAGLAILRVKFTHRYPESELVQSGVDADGNEVYKIKYSGRSNGKISNIEADSVWQKIDGVWYCRDAATRIKLGLNADIGAG